MDYDGVEDARSFWNRFDDLRGSRTVKDIADSIGIDYELIRVQRTRYRVPKINVAVKIANEVGSSVEYLVTGMNPGQLPEHVRDIVNRLLMADDVDLALVRRALKMEDIDDNKHQAAGT